MAAAIHYAVFARGGNIQEEFTGTNRSNDLKRVVEQLLFAMPKSSTGQKSYSHEGCLFNYLIDKDVVLLCVIGSESHNRLSFNLLQSLMDQFNTTRDVNAFKVTFRRELENFNKTTPSAQPFDPKIQGVKDQLDSVTGIMRSNIDKVLERGERLEVVLDKSETLADKASTFRSRSSDLKRKLCLANAKLSAILVCICIIVALFITLSVCGITFKSCGAGNSSDSSSGSQSSHSG